MGDMAAGVGEEATPHQTHPRPLEGGSSSITILDTTLESQVIKIVSFNYQRSKKRTKRYFSGTRMPKN